MHRQCYSVKHPPAGHLRGHPTIDSEHSKWLLSPPLLDEEVVILTDVFVHVNTSRYSLTMHHSNSDLKAFGMTDDMIADQEW